MRSSKLLLLFLTTLAFLVYGCQADTTPSPATASNEITPIVEPTASSTSKSTLSPTSEPTHPPTIPPTLLPTLKPDTHELGDTYQRQIDGMIMVYVPSGEFEMGAPGGGDTMRTPIHTVALDGFWIDLTEVANQMYERCVNAKVCEPSAYAEFEGLNGSDQPVVGVTWHQAQTYCEWVGGRLPTEAQWEYAARGPENRTYPWGEEEPDCNKANFGAWEGCVGTTAEVGSYPEGASWCGALDMAGNVYEWVQNWFYEYTAGRKVNPGDREGGERKMMRGGAWTDFGPHLLSAQRMRSMPGDYADTVGIRCIMAGLEN